MNRKLALASVISAILLPWQSVAQVSTPSIDWQPQEYSFVEVDLEGSGSYKQLVSAKDEVEISIKWNAWSGDGGDSYKVYFDNTIVNQGDLAAGSKSGVITFPYTKSGRHTLTLELCNDSGCATSDDKAIVIADTDGGHLEPLSMDVDPNNKSYSKQEDTVVGAYFVEWGIYGRDYDVSNIPAHNLTHILYGFIPICGENESLKSNSGGWNALQTACADSQDYEVVIHDPWAAIQKALPGIDTNDPIRGTYAQIMALKQRYPDLKILPSVGGWTLSDPFHGFTEKANRDTFVASVKQFLKTWKFYDGVDIDWEYPGGSGPNVNLGDTVNDGPAYVALMAELRAMLDELETETGRDYQLTSAIGVGFDKIEDVDYGQAIQYMDYIFGMSYDFYGGWNNVTGHQTGLYCGEHISADECAGTGLDDKGEPRKGPAYTTNAGVEQLLAQGVPANQIAVGVAMYARGWEGVYPENTIADNPMTAEGNGKLTGSTTDGIWEAGIQDYKGVKRTVIGDANTGINGFELGYDAQAEAAFAWNRTSGKLLTYDSERSVKAKGAYVRNLGLAGLFAWEIDADNGDILNAMHEGLANGETTNRPPVVSLASTFSVKTGASLSLTVSATDPDNDTLTYLWQVPAELNATGTDSPQVSIIGAQVNETTDYTVKVSVSDGTETVTRTTTVTVTVDSQENTAPVVTAINNISMVENNNVDVAVSATDEDGDTLSYSWSVPTGLTLQGSGANVSLTADPVDADTNYTVSVAVSDGTDTVSTSFTVTVTNENDTGTTTWNADATYVAGDTVIYNDVEYKAKWWTKGDNPENGGPWEALSDNNGEVNQWNASKAYNGGDKVTHNGTEYQAKWWTQGEEPGVAAVWNKL